MNYYKSMKEMNREGLMELGSERTTTTKKAAGEALSATIEGVSSTLDTRFLMLDSRELYYSILKNASSNSGLPSYFFMKNPGMLSMFSKIAGFREIPA